MSSQNLAWRHLFHTRLILDRGPESTRDWGCGGVKKLAARNSKGTGGSFVRHLNRPWHLFDSFFGRVARYGPVSVALLSIVQKKRFTPFSSQAKSMGEKICMLF
jgi:hypothetical protein